MLESISCDGEVYVVALLSNDSGPECRNPGRIHRARKLLTCLREPDIRLLFRTRDAGQFGPLGSDSERLAVLTTSVSFRKPIDGSTGPPWGRLASLVEYATREDVLPGASGLLRIYRPLGSLGVRLGTYQRKLGGVTVYPAFVTLPGPPNSCPRLRAGDLPRVMLRKQSEGALLSYAHHAVAVCLPSRAKACQTRAGLHHLPGWPY